MAIGFIDVLINAVHSATVSGELVISSLTKAG